MSAGVDGCARCAELQAAYDDFQEQSRELEEGLEQELQAAQKQVETIKSKLDKATAALSAERESNRASSAQLHNQISALQGELARSTAAIEQLKVVKRSSETSATGADEKLRRLEAAAADAAERADSFAEQAVLLKVELEEHQQMHAEQEARNKQALKELQEELHRVQRQAEAEGGAATGAAGGGGGGAAIDDAELQALREELEVLREEKAALNNDIEEVTTDLTRVQEENEALTEELEALKNAAPAAAGDAVPVGGAAAPTESLPADLERIAALTAELEAAQDAQAAAQAAQRDLQADFVAQLAAKQSELDAALTQAQSASASSSSAGAAALAQAQAAEVRADELAKQLAAAQTQAQQQAATLAEERRAHEQALRELTKAHEDRLAAALKEQHSKAESQFNRQLSELTAARAADAAAAESARAALSASLAEQSAAAKASSSSLSLAQSELRAAQQLAAAGANDKEQLAAQRAKELTEQLAALQTRVDSSDSARERAEATANDAQQKLAATQAQTESLRKEVTAAKEEVARARADAATQAATLRAELEQTRSATAAAEQAAASAKAEAAAAAAVVAASSANNHSATSTTEAAELTTVREQLRAAEAELRSVQSQLNVEQDLHAAFEQSFSESESKRAQLAAQLQISEEKVASSSSSTTSAAAKANGNGHSSSLRDRRRAAATAAATSGKDADADAAAAADDDDPDAAVNDLSLQLNGHHAGLLSESELLSPGGLLSPTDVGTPRSSASSSRQPSRGGGGGGGGAMTTTSSSSSSTSAASPSPSPSAPSESSVERSSGSFAMLAPPGAEQVGELSKSLRSTLGALSTEVSVLAPSHPVPAATLGPLVSSLSSDIDTSVTLLTSLSANLAEATERELDLVQKLQGATQSGGNIRVFCRVRPMLAHEMADASSRPREEHLLAYPSEQQISIRADVARRNRTKLTDVPSHRGHTNSLPDVSETGHASDYTNPAALASYTPFAFDRVFQPQDGQVAVFEAVKDMILPVLNGFRSCIFAYGQTGSGKTFTMGAEVSSNGADDPSVHAIPEDAGITYRSLALLFRGIANRGKTFKYEVRLTVLELYNEAWQDLLEGATIGKDVVDDEDGDRAEVDEASGEDDDDAAQEEEQSSASAASADNKKKAKLFVRKNHHGHYVEGASRRVVSSVGEVMSLLAYSYRKRHCESTALNETSSRSHLLLQVDVVGVNVATQVTSFGRLSLVDLAGSERVSRSGVTGARLTEAVSINKSLSALADVFIALTDTTSQNAGKMRHVPFRNSKLTMLLQDSFVGASRTLMFANISPASMHAGETLCSLQFAARARQVRLSNAQASLDGWGLKYKQLMTAQTAAFATREKSYQAQFKALKLSVKTKTAALEGLQAEMKLQQEKVSELSRALDRSEADRMKALTSALPGSSTRDRRLEATEDRKWAALQADLQAAQAKAADARAQMERAGNEAKERYQALEAQLKEANEKLRLAKLELKGIKPPTTFGGSSSTTGGDSDAQAAGGAGGSGGTDAEGQAEIISGLNRKVALLELEVKRLKLVQRSQFSSLRSPSKAAQIAASTARNATASAASLSVATAEEEGPATREEESNGTTSPQSAISTASAPPSSRSSLSGAGVSGPAPSPSGLRPLSAVPRATTGALAAAKQAALLAQRRAQEAQNKSGTGSSSTFSSFAGASDQSDSGEQHTPYVAGSIMAKRRSLLPPPTTKTIPIIAAAPKTHARTSSTGSDRGASVVSSPNLGPTGAGGASVDELALEEASMRSEDGSETSDAAAAAVTTTGAGTVRPRRSSIVSSSAATAAAALAARKAKVGISSTGTRMSRTNSTTSDASSTSGAPASTAPNSGSRLPPPGSARTSIAGGATGVPKLTKTASSASPADSQAAAAPAPAPRSMLRPPTTLAFPAPTSSASAAKK